MKEPEHAMTPPEETEKSESIRSCMSRRRFLLSSSGAAVTTVLLPSCLPTPDSTGGPTESSSPGGATEELQAEVAGYARKQIAKLGDLKNDAPITFNYPYDDLNSLSFIVKLGVPAGGGVGPGSDIVAFSTLCTHMGGDLSGTTTKYLKDHQIVGPCPLHLTTFDLTRYGMVVAGQATESLPQVVLEVEGDAVYATGVLGLIYGKRDNVDRFVI